MNLLRPRNDYQTWPARCDVCGHRQGPVECFVAVARTYRTYCGDCYEQKLFRDHWWSISRASAIATLKVRHLHSLVEQIPASGKFYRSVSPVARVAAHLTVNIVLKDNSHIGWIESAALGWLRTIVARQILSALFRPAYDFMRGSLALALVGLTLSMREMERQRRQAREAERLARKPVQLALPIAV